MTNAAAALRPINGLLACLARREFDGFRGREFDGFTGRWASPGSGCPLATSERAETDELNRVACRNFNVQVSLTVSFCTKDSSILVRSTGSGMW
jgi:hypothetical protein